MADHSKRAFEDSVKAILTTFGVFTGFVIKSAIDGIKFPPTSSWWASLDALLDLMRDPQVYICLATVALLLRFIIGSAVHLNLCYVVEPRSKMPVMLFKDLAFLIVFGLLAVFMVKANDDVEAFAARAGVFLLISVIWSWVDWVVRDDERGVGEQSLFSSQWVWIDAFQLAVILLALLAPFAKVSDLPRAILLAVAFSIALYLDMRVVLAAEKPEDPEAAAVAAAAAVAGAAAVAAAADAAIAAAVVRQNPGQTA
jgi:drug/metabolite transporter superfamily protein YnfA